MLGFADTPNTTGEEGDAVEAPDTTAPPTDEGTAHEDSGAGDHGGDTSAGEDAGGSTTGGDTGDKDTGGPPPSGAVLVINEIMYNPKASDDDLGEWVELHNAGDAPVDLDGWTLRDNGSNSHVISSSVVVAPGAYSVLGRSGDSSGNGGYTPAYTYADFFLANSADSVVLEDPSGAIVDQLSYKTEAPWPENLAGVSIELQSPELDNSAAGSWLHAVAVFGAGDLGTPGGPNGMPEPAFVIDGTVSPHQQPLLNASLRFSPFDDVELLILDQLKTAQTQVRLAYFNIRLAPILWALEDLMEDGVDVEVILDGKVQALEFNTMAEDLIKAGIPVTLVEKEVEQATMHHKFTVIDGERVLAGSANLSSTALNKSDEDLIFVESADLAQRYLDEFEEIKADGYQKSAPYPSGTAIRAWMGPEDNLDDKTVEVLESAKLLVLVAMFQINQQGLVDALIAAKQKGVTVVVVIDALYKAEESPDEQLIAAGIPLILAENTLGMFSEMHSKLVIVDHETVMLGSFNWTNLASFHNDETLIVIDDEHLAARAEGKFAELIKSYGTQSATEYGLTGGDATVTLGVSNVTLDADAQLLIQSIGGGPFAEPTPIDGTSISLVVARGTRLDYRFGVAGPGGTVWENGKHFFTVPYAPGDFAVSDAFAAP